MFILTLILIMVLGIIALIMFGLLVHVGRGVIQIVNDEKDEDNNG